MGARATPSTAAPPGTTQFVEVLGRRLEYVEFPASAPDRPVLLLLHEGLGSVEMWRGFPRRLAAETGSRTLAYSRWGYGRSDSPPTPRSARYLHQEALETLPELRAALGLERPVLVGHSDGGSIALIHAGESRWPVAGLVVMAPHEFVEPVTLDAIRAAGHAWRTTDLPERLGRYHRDPARVFFEWHDTWLSPAFRDWNIEASLSAIRCPVLAVQGEDDEYATMAQLDAIAAQAVAAPRVEQLRLSDCGHVPHRDQPEDVLSAIRRFVTEL